MKRYLFLLNLLLFIFITSQQVRGQFLKKLADKVSDKTAEERKPISKNYSLEFTGTGPDLYLEYRMNMGGEESSEYQVDMHMKMIASPSTGKGRSEIVMEMPVIGSMTLATLTDASAPLHIVFLNERKKQYSVMDLSEMDEADADESYTVTKLGEEKLHGLHTIHSKAVNKDGQSFEIWTTTEVPGYEKMVALYSKSQQMGSGDLWKELQKANAAGFLVKLKVDTEGGTSSMELTEMKKIDAPAALFEIPDGYKENSGGWVKRFMNR